MAARPARNEALALCWLVGAGCVCLLAAEEPRQTPKNTISVQLPALVKPQTFSRPVSFYVVEVIDRTGDPDPMMLYPDTRELREFDSGLAIFLDREPKTIVRQALEDSLRAAGMLAAEEASAEYLLAVYLFHFGAADCEAGRYSKVELNVEVKNPQTGKSEQVMGLGTAFKPTKSKIRPWKRKEIRQASLSEALEAALQNFLGSSGLRQVVETLAPRSPRS